MQSDYSFLVYFQKGEVIANSFLLRKGFSQDDIDSMVEKDYIQVCNVNFDERKYIITEKGIKRRDY